MLLKNAMGRKFHHNYSQSEATNFQHNPVGKTMP